MKFLENLIDQINEKIMGLLTKASHKTPPFVFESIELIKHLPEILKNKLKTLIAKLNIYKLKTIGYSEHYITLVKGKFVESMIYFKSDEFKSIKKSDYIFIPFKYIKNNPLKSASVFSTIGVFAIAAFIITKNTSKIIEGTAFLRKPASFDAPIEDKFINLKARKFEAKLKSIAGGGHGGSETSSEHQEKDVFLDIEIEALSTNHKQNLEEAEEMLEDFLEAIEIEVASIPMDDSVLKELGIKFQNQLNHDFEHIGFGTQIKQVKLKQVMSKRPDYYKKLDRTFTVQDIDFQIFLEDTHRNRQVYVDFSLVASNRNIVNFIKDHLIELKDHLNSNIEPILPRLPIEEEGRQIIKDKIRTEIDIFLQKNKVEGKIEEVYIEYLMAS